MKRLLNYIISIKHSEIFSLRLLPFLLGITLFLIWYSTYISNTNVSNVKVKYNSVNLRADSLNYTFYVLSKETNKSPEYDKIEIQEFTSRMDSIKFLPVQFDSLHLHHYRSTMIITKVMYTIKDFIIYFLKITGFVHQNIVIPICLSLKFKGIRY